MTSHRIAFLCPPWPARANVYRIVVYVCVLSFSFGFKTIELHASPQTANARQEKHGNSILGKPDAVMPSDTGTGQPLERWHHVVHRTKGGESIVSLLTRFNLSQPGKRLWMDVLRR